MESAEDSDLKWAGMLERVEPFRVFSDFSGLLKSKLVPFRWVLFGNKIPKILEYYWDDFHDLTCVFSARR